MDGVSIVGTHELVRTTYRRKSVEKLDELKYVSKKA